jgi:hypothetical protein
MYCGCSILIHSGILFCYYLWMSVSNYLWKKKKFSVQSKAQLFVYIFIFILPVCWTGIQNHKYLNIIFFYSLFGLAYENHYFKTDIWLHFLFCLDLVIILLNEKFLSWFFFFIIVCTAHIVQLCKIDALFILGWFFFFICEGRDGEMKISCLVAELLKTLTQHI